MERIPARRWWSGLGGWEKLALVLWTVVVCGLITKSLLAPAGKNSVYPDYHWALERWCRSADTYPNGTVGNVACNYRYSPLVTATLAPLGLLPLKAGEVLWRLLIVGCFLAGLSVWMRDVLPQPIGRSQKAILLLLVFPLIIGNVHNGQANLLVLGLLLVSLSGVSRQRWGLAAVCAALATFLKVYPVALGVLLACLYPRRFLPKFLVALAVGLVVPFLFQDPAYVARQYSLWFEYLRVEDRSHLAVAGGYVHVQMLFRVWLVPINRESYRLIELAAGTLVASLCIAGRLRGDDQRRLWTLLLDLACCWMTAFGPTTESSTYALLAPSLAWAVLGSRLQRQPFWARGLLTTCYLALLSAQIVVWFPRWVFDSYRVLGPQPLAALLFLTVRIVEHFLVSARAVGSTTPGLPAPVARAA